MSPYHRLERTADPFGKDLFKGSPNRGGLDYRVCMESWELYSGEEMWEKSVALKNDAFFLLEDIPHLIDIGVHCLKVQGREYSVPLVERMVRFYRDLIDAYLAFPKGEGSPFQLSPWQSRLAAIQAERDAARSDGTRMLLAEARQPVGGVRA
jgi:putative protease